MQLTIEEAIEWIHSRLPFGSRPGLDRINALLEKIDHPENKVPTIHIAGTNGKGSTVTYLRCLLEEMGLKVGTFTSPYIESFNERIAINGQPISDEQLITYVEKYQPIIKELDQITEVAGITEFETLTGMALDYFVNEQVDIAVVEVGLGGLLDSTNVVKPLLTGITTIGKDHTEILGETIAEIAYQKAGIIKEKVPVVTGNICADALAVIEKVAQEKQSPIFRFGKEYQVEYLHPDTQWGEVFNFYGEMGKLTKIKVPLLGRHQVENAAVAIQLFDKYCQLQHLPFKERDITQGLAKAQWPARMERLSDEPLIVLDGAHNDHAVKRLVENLRKEFPQHTIHILFSALATKDVDEMIQDLKQVSNAHLYLTSFDYPKAIALTEMEKYEDDLTEIVSLWQFGLGEILEKMSTDDLLLVTGSLYFVSQVRELLLTIGGNDEEI
ncbi:bifunctional folylpolyglutamate synthase/dihydrofolate synthase [Enterococcus faecalis]|uniref:bifunctional folylpolyglutamate synthase/dihydrofolate synthase n=1 Tax=Enterococcus TaxID=1350 RepID=UPI000A34BDB2|nr:folylpolyglutamate synthase/dihydrofolate synthase family protein [Enterococcus faecalis]NSV50968.1 bifunctional folylpolyglutamate synthase/dihydrofolate synthase [Enterococcus faecalis]NSW33444.1 bifunctional folylpolyglutamate synthase/dihydrofolate synthase [Enterococcus faecalis]OTP38074.1 FolC family protein [Enterococcus faecalis]OTP44630.1 FolC family protein [Enterococcus faecalis]TQA38996.1 bifunctional folylpolyglutamate synthase/dihydrofolate synthase [Enterococcus faecalis]